MNLRESFFWIADRLFKNGVIKGHYNEIKKINEGNGRELIGKKLKRLLTYSQKHTQFYKKLNKDNSLKNFPVIDKKVITENYLSFLSDQFKSKNLHSVVTSGSTGTPFKVYQNDNKKYRNTADTLYFGGKSGFRMGDKLYYFKIWNEINSKSRLLNFMQNIVPIDVMKTSEKQFKILLRDMESNSSRIALLGYASFFDQMIEYLDIAVKRPLKCEVSSIITMAESLSDSTRNKMEYYFRTPVISRYSNSENGIIAQEEKDRAGIYKVNEASYFIEILDFEKDVPVGENRLGRIVVTDLFNYAVPFIRYDTGDAGMFFIDSTGKKYLKNIEGRVMDLVYDTNGDLVSSFTITNNMWKYDEIDQYQFLQTDHDEYVFKLNLGSKRFERENELINEFKKYFGSDSKILVRYVNEIPVLRSGKRKKVVNCTNQSAV